MWSNIHIELRKKEPLVSLKYSIPSFVFLSLLAYYATFCDHFCLKEGKKTLKNIVSFYVQKKNNKQKNNKKIWYFSLLFILYYQSLLKNKQTKNCVPKNNLVAQKRSFFFRKSSRLFFSFFPLDTVLLTAFFFRFDNKT